MEPNQYLVKHLQHLKVGIVARESFLNELSLRIEKARKIFGKYDQEIMDSQVFTESTLQFLDWLNRYVQNGVSKIKSLDQRIGDEETQLYYDATYDVAEGKTLCGIFIPIPALAYDDVLQDFSVRKTIAGESKPGNRSALTKPLQPFRSVSLINLESGTWHDCEDLSDQYDTPLMTPSASTAAGDGQRFPPPKSTGMYFTSSGSFPELSIVASDESQSASWPAPSSCHAQRPTTAIPSSFDQSLDEFELGISSSSERIRSTITDFQEFVIEMHSRTQIGFAPSVTRSLESLESHSQAVILTSRRSVSDTSVHVTFESSLNKESSRSVCPKEFSNFPFFSVQRSPKTPSDILLEEAVNELRKELSARSLEACRYPVHISISKLVFPEESNEVLFVDKESSRSLPSFQEEEDCAAQVSKPNQVFLKIHEFNEEALQIVGSFTKQLDIGEPTESPWSFREDDSEIVEVPKKHPQSKVVRESLERKWMEAARQLLRQKPPEPHRRVRSGTWKPKKLPTKRNPIRPKPSDSLRLRPGWDHTPKWKSTLKKSVAQTLRMIDPPKAGNWKNRLRRQIMLKPNTELFPMAELKDVPPCALTVRKIPRLIDLPTPIEVKDTGTWKPFGRKIPEPPEPRPAREPVKIVVEDEGTWKPKGVRGPQTEPEREPLMEFKDPFPLPFVPKPPPTYAGLHKRLVLNGERPVEIEKTLKARAIQIPGENVKITVPSHVVPPKKVFRPDHDTPIGFVRRHRVKLTKKRSQSMPNIREKAKVPILRFGVPDFVTSFKPCRVQLCIGGPDVNGNFMTHPNQRVAHKTDHIK